VRMSWGTGLAIVYISFAAATIGFVVFATTQHIDLVRPDYYEESLARNERSVAEQQANALGNSVTIATEAGAIFVHVPQNVAHAKGSVQLYRVAASKEDVTVPLALDSTGTMRIDMSKRSYGRWDVTVAWNDGKDYRYTRHVFVEKP